MSAEDYLLGDEPPEWAKKGYAMATVREERPFKKKGGKKKAGSTLVPVDVSLPTEKTKPSDSIQDYLFLLFGEKKIGKTSLASRMKRTFFMFFEPGGKGLRLFGKPVRDWREARGYLKLIRKDKSFDTVVIDTVDRMVKRAEEWVREHYGVEDIGDEGYGKGWRKLRDEVERFLVDLTATGKGVVLISHAAEMDIARADGTVSTKIGATMPKQAREIVEGMADIWAYYRYDGNRRVLQILGDENVSAGHRLEERFRTPEGKRVRSIDMGSSSKEAYQNLVDAFDNKYVPPVKKGKEKRSRVSLKKK